ncbi:4'-phosphopantetheinyl transferase superfamily protein [Streptomyces sp. NPDC021356]|uniref:4'-phosphopantetheinyl transferase superfamily protein n=1 Tax=Streptomyces sp. NPDC021356 TaxID=3154900 RepID=UPI0033FF6325
MRTAAKQVARVGLDVLDRSELRRLIERPWFLRFSFAPEEIAHAETLGEDRRLEFLAGRFAAKEALLKVLGIGFLQGVTPREICVEHTAHGAPVVHLRGRAAQLTPSSISVSITHKQNVVAAVAISLPEAKGATTDDATSEAARNGRTEPTAPKELDAVPPPNTPATATVGTSTRDEREAQTTAFLRVRVGQEEAHYGGNLVDGARILRLFGDLVTEITLRTDGDEGLLAQYSDIRFTAPVRPGDYIEAHAWLVHQTRLRRVVELEAHKVIRASPEEADSAGEVLDEPQLVCAATATTVVPHWRAHTTTARIPTAEEA